MIDLANKKGIRCVVIEYWGDKNEWRSNERNK
jgi:hypothetical protein